MAIYTIKEMAQLSGKKPKNIHTYISRGKLIKNKHRQIDTSEPINAVWLEENRINNDTPTAENKEVNTSPIAKINLELKQLQVEKGKKDLEIREIENRKKRGELVNLEETANTVKAYSDGLKRELDQNIQTFIQDICTRHGIDSGKAGEYKLKVSDYINKANRIAIEIVEKKFKNDL